jgi:hypothetical protein
MRAMRTNPWMLERKDSTGAGRWLVVACLIGCNAPSERADRDPTPRPESAGASAPVATGDPPRPTGQPAASSPAALPVAPSTVPGDLSGSWVGGYDAKKGAVLLPPKVKDKALAADDGKAAVGQGSIVITILPGGDVRGTMSGPLGAGAITGRVDGSTIRCVVRPDEPQAATAMTGIFIAERKGEVIAGELRVAGPDATVIRESAVELKRKK